MEFVVDVGMLLCASCMIYEDAERIQFSIYALHILLAMNCMQRMCARVCLRICFVQLIHKGSCMEMEMMTECLLGLMNAYMK